MLSFSLSFFLLKLQFYTRHKPGGEKLIAAKVSYKWRWCNRV